MLKFREIYPTSNGGNRALFTGQKILADSQTVVTARPQQCTHSAPDFIEIGSLSAELKTNAFTPFFCPVEYFDNSPEAMFRLESNTQHLHHKSYLTYLLTNLLILGPSMSTPANSYVRHRLVLQRPVLQFQRSRCECIARQYPLFVDVFICPSYTQ